MNHRLIQLTTPQGTEAVILLDRLEYEDDRVGDWQVFISVFVNEERRYNEWAFFKESPMAQGFIRDFSETSAQLFLERADAWLKRTSIDADRPSTIPP